MSKHTPGPWKADAHDVMNPDRVFGIIAHDDAEGEDGDATQCVAEVCDGPTAEADARLIAAAPELLEALNLVKMARDAWRSDDPNATIDSITYMDRLDDIDIDAAIAKATGGEA